MTWQRMYASSYIASFENKERDEVILIGNINNNIKITVNNNTIGTTETQLEAKDIVMKYIKENP